VFRCVVLIREDGTVVVDSIADDGRMVEQQDEYTSFKEVPQDLQDKIKQLMWTPPNDHTLVEGLGLRIGDKIYWIHESGE